MSAADMYPLCRHVKVNGLQCESPAIAGEHYCFFHHRLLARHAGFRHTKETGSYLMHGQNIQLSAIEDRDSVQLALSLVINALALGQLETRRATALLYGLQLASNNAARLTKTHPKEVVVYVESTPDDLDLAEPGATVDLGPEPAINWADFEDEEEDESQEDLPKPAS